MDGKRHMNRPVNLEEADDGVVEFSPLNQEDEGTVTIEVPVPEERAAWGSKMQFMLSCISLSVGLGNVWRFPYLVQQDGGGAFLIPYLIMMVLEGAPLFLLELGIGQRLRQGSLGVWTLISPWWGGLGVASTIVSYLVGLYYNVIIAWCFYYLFNSFKSPLPFGVCPNETLPGSNVSTIVQECADSSETAYFWYRQTIDASPSIDETGGIKWWMACCLTLSWVLVWLCIMKGIQSSGKVVYFTALFPYCILIIFFGRAVTLKGAGAGLKHMFTPDLTKLLDPTVWMDAACQVFYSLGLAFGSLIAFASYNPMKNNCRRDALFMCVITVFTATFATIDIFAVLGFKAVANYEKCVEHNINFLQKNIIANLSEHRDPININEENYEDVWPLHYQRLSEQNMTHHLKNCSVEDELNQAAEGTGLAFIVFTQAIVELPGSNFWSVCFFMMLLALGLGSQFGTMEGVITNLFDMKIFARVRKEILTGCVCLSSLLIGMIFCTGAGEYWLGMFDTFAGSMGLIVIAFFETIVISYVYGHKKFSSDIEKMIGEWPGLYWQATWRFISPITIFSIVVASVYHRITHPPTYPAWDMYEGKAEHDAYPGWAMFVCLLLLLAGFLPIPIVYFMRRFQCIRFDSNIHEASIKRVETTMSTQGMIKGEELEEYHDSPGGEDEDDDNGLTVQGGKFRMEVID